MEKVLQDVRKERERQTEKWGEQMHSFSKWISILTEEVGEAAREINDYEALIENFIDDSFTPNEEMEKDMYDFISKARIELIQVAAVAVQIVEFIDKKNNPSSHHLFKATLNSDYGKFILKIYAPDKDSAIQSIMKSEKCPRSAIINIEKIIY